MSVENSLFGFRGNSILVVYLCDFFKQTLGSRPSRFSFFGYEPGSGPSPILAGFEQPSLREGRGQWNKWCFGVRSGVSQDVFYTVMVTEITDPTFNGLAKEKISGPEFKLWGASVPPPPPP